MKTFAVYQSKDGKLEAIKRGFCWPLFLLSIFSFPLGPILYALLKKQWQIAIFAVVVEVGFSLIEFSHYPYWLLLSHIITWMLFSFKFNALSEYFIVKRGGRLISCVEAKGVVDACFFGDESRSVELAQVK
ncbi:hypothetical protein [Neptunomonas concharum]|uniref:DUF2628 domain-containing protein n=1 Tax=Neptunomonas concharum TaxID=1031538 RepID=A0A5P1RAI8_9GAMM|nr:hypothetical protein [Neptunomonas concharum]QEQ96659.1 hypothetical protein F0U83_07990 [Neptunomonas concharum]